MKQHITVFCGARTGARPEYLESAQTLGKLLGQQGRSLIYGGGKLGLMGTLAQAALENGAHVTSITTRRFSDPSYHQPTHEEIMTETLAQRKTILLEKADACIALPGVIGTLDEWSEVVSLLSSTLTDKPIGLLNTCGYYETLMQFMAHMAREGFCSAELQRHLIIADTPEELLRLLDDAT